MSDLEHKGYLGTAELSAEDGVFHGRLAYIRDLVSYESSTAKGLLKAFREAVDTYLTDCAREGRAPDKPFKGQFNIRTRPELHRALALKAMQRGVSLNELVTDALEKAV
jgi:predicted HicB family RNase H-like nuclease